MNIDELAKKYEILNVDSLIYSLSNKYKDVNSAVVYRSNINIDELANKYKILNIDSLSSKYQVNNTQNEPTIKTPQKIVQENKSKDVTPKDDIYYQPTDIEKRFFINQKSKKALFGMPFNREEYIKTINKLVDNPKIKDILECLKSMKLKTNIQKDLEYFKITYTQKAISLKLDDFDEAYEKLTDKFLSIIHNDFSPLLDASMKKLKSNPRDKVYGNLMECIIQYLSEVGFFVPDIHKKPIDKQSNYFEIIPTPSPKKEYHGMIKDILRFPYFIAYYDEYGDKKRKFIKGSCIIYSKNCN